MSSSSCIFYSQDAHRRELHIRLCSAEISLRIEQYASVPCNIDLIARLGPPVNFQLMSPQGLGDLEETLKPFQTPHIALPHQGPQHSTPEPEA